MTPASEYPAGPYNAVQQAADDADELRIAANHPGGISGANYERLMVTCEHVGIPLGDFDARILVWLAGWEPETCQVIIGLIGRAYFAGRGRR